jgi:hypothetical protein
VVVVDLEVSPAERARLNQLSTGQAALDICRHYLQRIHPGASFVPQSPGADLRVRLSNGEEFDLEVKGTERSGPAWAQFKVSSQQSHNLLVQGMPVYRVTEIRSAKVRLLIMKYGEDSR